MGFSQTVERIVSGFAILYVARHRERMLDPFDQIVVTIVVGLLIMLVTYLQSQTARLSHEDYRLYRSVSENVLHWFNIVLVWVFITVVSDYYSDSLDPFVTVESIYRTLIVVFFLLSIASLVAHFKAPPSLHKTH